MSSVQRVTLWDDNTNKAFIQGNGSDSFATGQANVTTSSTLVAAARSGRRSITLTPTSSVIYYVGNSGVTTTNGIYVAAGASITLTTSAAIYAVGAAAVTISYVETF